MGRSKRNKRNSRGQAAGPGAETDPHIAVIADSWAAMLDLANKFATPDASSEAIEIAFAESVDALASKMSRFDAIRLIEVARMSLLPMAPEGVMANSADAGAANVELLALVALAVRPEPPFAKVQGKEVQSQEMSEFVAGAKEELNALLRLAQFRAAAQADPTDKMSMVSLLIQGSEIWVRNLSYPEMVSETNLALLDGDSVIQAALTTGLGFNAGEALAILNACHDLQMVALNARREAMAVTMSTMIDSGEGTEHDPELVKSARETFNSVFEPEARDVTVTASELAECTGISETRVRAVIERFRLDLGASSVSDVVDAFVTGNNPMRSRPLIIAAEDRVMLAHNALNTFAVRENLEEYLKTTVVWDKYAKHRGDLLEARTRVALDRVLPGAFFRDAFEYYVAANENEEITKDPARYTKRVEGDHLVVLDDVAIIVEDKAVALSSLSRGGKKQRIRTDLTGIITKAAAQAGRMRDRIDHDGGLRIEGEGWVDLSHIREIHTIAVSLDDLASVLTATAHLIEADLLSVENIPWTVSLHDLELITQLIERPAEFLLYLRRRRDPEVTIMFSAPDELDLFLYFFEAGLWVEPNPEAVQAAFPFMPAPTTADRRRYRTQVPQFVTSRTDQLDQWFYSARHPDTVNAPKPTMVTSPAAALIDELESRRVTGWLSIGATLLSGSTGAQRQFARNGKDLLSNPSTNGRGRSLATPLTGTAKQSEGWLLIWATRPAHESAINAETHIRRYLRVKKHQLAMPRGAVFMYDESKKDLAGVYYDGDIGPLSAELVPLLASLRPASDLISRLPPSAKRSTPISKPAKRKKRR
ncbi:preprotein translocase subunit SecA [Cryobacterium arcticum]|uniref:preprotein translocase subunit SecA n=1 Tax=Cryobacterium arcticum TaxID=670052 RepID=UPI0011B430A5|nr:preprotein translocase subunit SecA [Cryobacterium arcticum]